MRHNPDTFCPACGAGNNCAIAAGKSLSDCWCREASVARSAVDALPGELRGQRCLCRDCVMPGDEGVRRER